MGKEYITGDSTLAAIAVGKAWSKGISGSAAANASGDAVFRTGTGTTKFNITSIGTSGPLFWTYLYEASGSSGITAASGFSASAAGNSRNRNYSNTSNVMWLTASGAVATTSATLLTMRLVGGGTGVGGNVTGGSNDNSCSWILKPSTVYNLKWINKGADDNQFIIRTIAVDL